MILIILHCLFGSELFLSKMKPSSVSKATNASPTIDISVNSLVSKHIENIINLNLRPELPIFLTIYFYAKRKTFLAKLKSFLFKIVF